MADISYTLPAHMSHLLGGSGRLGHQAADERLAEVHDELKDLVAGQRRLEEAVAALPRVVAAVVSGGGTSKEHHDDDLIMKRVLGSASRQVSSSDESVTSKPKGVKHRTSWPTTVQIHDNIAPRGMRRATATLDAQRFLGSTGTFAPLDPSLDNHQGVEEFIARQVHLRCAVFEPDSYWLIPHKVVIILALIHDLIIQPYVLAWDVPFSGEVMHTAELAVAFWWLDLFLNFFIGFYKDGQLETQLKVICQLYLKTWFLPDLIAVLGDIISLTDIVRDYLGRRFALRSLGVLRIHKLASMFGNALDNSLSENYRLAGKGVRLILFILWLNHCVCCTWYSIGINAPTDTGGRWLDSMSELGEDESNPQDLYRYATAFHWSMGQIMAGGIENLGARNSVERLYSIFILAIGMVTFSSIVSAISTAMMEMQMMYQEQTEKMRQLRLFLVQCAVNPRMAIRVQKQVAERMRRSKRLTEKDVKALGHMSSTLQAELRFEIFGPYLLRLPVLRICAHVEQATVQGMCAEAIEVFHLAKTDMLFAVDTTAAGCYFLIQGMLWYTLKASVMFAGEEKGTSVCHGTWFSEAALWTKWAHVGSMEACESCEVLLVNGVSLVTWLLKHPLIGAIIGEYGRQFHKRLMTAVPPNSPWPTDLHVPFTEYAELVLSMDPSIQEVVGQVTLHHVRQRQKMDATNFAELVEEVKAGKCAVMMNGDGEMERGVSLQVLNLQNDDGDVLVHIGKYKGGKQLSAICQLPGAKQEHQQTPNEAMDRLLGRLKPLVGRARFIGTEKKVEWKESPSYGMRTRYFRAIHKAEVETPPRNLRPVPVKDDHEESDREPKVYVLLHHEDPDSFDFYAWLAQDDFASLSESDKIGKQEIRGWLDGLELESLHEVLPESARHTHGRPSTEHTEAEKSEFEEARLFDVHGLETTSVGGESAETPCDPVKWQVEDWDVPELPAPERLPDNRLSDGNVVISWTPVHRGGQESVGVSPRPLTERSMPDPSLSPYSEPGSRSARSKHRRFQSRGGEL